MTLIVQGLFYIGITIAFFVMACKMWLLFQQGRNPLARYIALAFSSVTAQCFLMTVSVFLFSTNPFMIKILYGYAAEIFFLLSLLFMWVGVSYIYPKLPLIAALVSVFLLGAVDLYITHGFYFPQGINNMGIVDFTTPFAINFIDTFQMLFTYGVLATAFLIETFRKRLYFLGFELGIGFLIALIFVNITTQTTNVSVYYFGVAITSIGVLMLVLGMLVHPLFKVEGRNSI